MEKILNYTLTVLLVLLILTIPLPPRYTNIALILLAVASLITFKYRKEWNTPPLFFYFLMGTYLVRILWLMGAEDVRYALKTLEIESPVLAVPLIFCLFKISHQTREILLKAFAFMAFALMLYAFANLLFYIERAPEDFFEYIAMHLGNRKQMAEANMLNWRFAHPTFLSMVVIYGMHFLFFTKDHTFRSRLLFAVYALSATMFTVLSGSRAGVILLILSFLLYGFFAYKHFVTRRVPLFILSTLVLVASIIGIKKIWSLNYRTLDVIRPDLFARTIGAIKEKPFFGHGTGSIKKITYDEHLESVGYTINHAHNQFLTDLAQFGIIGALPLFMFVILAFRHSIRNGAWDLLCLIITLTLLMLIESPINSNKGVMPFVLAVSLLGFNPSEEHPAKELKGSNKLHTLI